MPRKTKLKGKPTTKQPIWCDIVIQSWNYKFSTIEKRNNSVELLVDGLSVCELSAIRPFQVKKGYPSRRFLPSRVDNYWVKESTF